MRVFRAKLGKRKRRLILIYISQGTNIMILAGFLIFVIIGAIMGVGLKFNMEMNYKAKEGSTIYETSIDYMKGHKNLYLLAFSFILIAVVFLFV